MNQHHRLVCLCLLLLSVTSTVTQASGQSQHPLSTYSFGEAKSHTHDDFTVEYGRYCGHGLVDDDSNTGGNHFLGNTICFDHWLYGETWLYFDWPADPHAGEKIMVWESGSQRPKIWVTYDQTCLLVTVADTRSPYQ